MVELGAAGGFISPPIVEPPENIKNAVKVTKVASANNVFLFLFISLAPTLKLKVEKLNPTFSESLSEKSRVYVLLVSIFPLPILIIQCIVYLIISKKG